MTIALGIYDLFAYLIPGALYLSLFAYIADRFDWVSTQELFRSPSLLTVAILIAGSYIIGQATYRVRFLIVRMKFFQIPDAYAAALAKFKNSGGVDPTRPFLTLSGPVLLAAAELHNREVAAEISRLRAVGIMLRCATPPLALATLTASVEIFTNTRHAFALAVFIIMSMITYGCWKRGATMREWAFGKTFEICYHIRGLDDLGRGI